MSRNAKQGQRGNPLKSPEDAGAFEAFRQVFEEMVENALGTSVKEVTIYYIRKKLGADPFKVFYENPTAFYKELQAIFSEGAKLIIKLLAEEINRRQGVGLPAETFLKYVTTEDLTLRKEWQQLLTQVFGK